MRQHFELVFSTRAEHRQRRRVDRLDHLERVRLRRERRQGLDQAQQARHDPGGRSAKQMTVYMFEADKGPKPNCDSACAKAWPPLTTSGNASAGGKAVSSDLGTTMRSNGTEQVTYKGHPLYYFIKDKDDGDAYGQAVHAFGADWYVVAPSGNKVDNS
jgi:predicted lipoprotein with Yx(FWY)xxD motif